MPRTKRPIRNKEKVVEDDFIKKIRDVVEQQKNKLDIDGEMECKNIELAFKILLESIKESDLQKTVGQLKNELPLKEVTNTTTRRSSTRRSAISRDDGYLTENSSQGSGGRAVKAPMGSTTSSRKPARRSRSASSAGTCARAAPRRRSRSVYRTPAYNKHAAVNYPPITPKVAPHAALTVLRQPRKGEMVVSMSGSPVMVPAVCTIEAEERANCNILLNDGTMLSVQPKQLRTSQAFIPYSLMDPGVLRQLKTLKDNLEKVVKLTEDNM